MSQVRTWKKNIVLEQDPDEVWKKIGDFLDLSWAGVPVQKLNDFGGRQIGARREVAGGPSETLLEHSDTERYYIYDIYNVAENKDFSLFDLKVAVGYRARLQVEAVTGGVGKSIVSWSNEWTNLNGDGEKRREWSEAVLGGALKKLI